MIASAANDSHAPSSHDQEHVMPLSMFKAEQAALSWFNMSVYAVAQSLLWLYLYYNPRHQMRGRACQTLWQLIGYSVLWLLGAIGLYQQDLMHIFTHMHDVWSYPAITQHVSRAYFEMEIAWYCSQLFTLFIQCDLKDFYVMLFHHIVTPIEIYYSYQCGYAAIGMLIMFLHDTSDVCLHIAKTFFLFSFKAATDTAFVLFAICFAFTRLVLLPMCPHAYFTGSITHQSTCGHALATTCSVLVLLHCYWFFLIVKMIQRFARAGAVEGDIREGEVEDKHRRKIKQVSTTVSNGSIGSDHASVLTRRR